MSAARGMLILAAVAALGSPGAAPAQSTHLLVISGLGGTPEFSERFSEWATTLVSAAEEKYALPSARTVYLAEQAAAEGVDGRSTKAEILRHLEGLRESAGPADRLLLVLIGHGSADDAEARVNLPGPDLTAAELARALDSFAPRTVAIVNAASASGDFQEKLAGRNRIVITSTSSGMERNASIFGGYFAEALAGDGADVDKDGRVSILEAFEFARREVERFYESGNRLQTEHATLTDADQLARAFFLGSGRGSGADDRASLNDPEVRALEMQVQELKDRKSDMRPEEYQRRLEELLIELALKSREVRARGASR